MSFLNTLETVLKQDERLIADDGSVIKSKAYDLGVVGDVTLLKILLGNSDTKTYFFKDVDGVLVFDSIKFGWTVTSREFLPDSYTKYKNKIGLVDYSGRSIAQSKDVCLVWPYKDCVLEGGQTKEDQKRDEIFYNETLAPDEVNHLLYPKVFAGTKRYDKNGVEEIIEFRDDDNLIIKGNNLLALTSLLKRYENQVKCIYIDPPYYFNAKKDEDTFEYNSNFKLSSWLVFMKNRLEYAKRLLREDGAIFVQISDDGVAELHCLLKEIFNQNGENNFINKITVKTKSPSGFASVNAGVFETAEYILAFAKNKRRWTYNPQYIKSDYDANYKWYVANKSEEYPEWTIKDIFEVVAVNQGFSSKQEAINSLGSSAFMELVSIFALQNADCVFQSTAIGNNAGQNIVEVRDISKKNRGVVYQIQRDNHYDVYVLNGREMAFYSKKIRLIDGENVPSIQLSNIWTDTPYEGIAQEGNVSLKGGKKPEKLLRRIIEMSTDKDDIVMDYHLGSGTTCAVAHKLGRRYIGIEQLNYNENDSVIRLQNVINGDTSGISKFIDWQGGGSFVYTELKQLNEQYIEKVIASTTNDEINILFEEINQSGFISQKVNPADIDITAKDFLDLSFADKQRLLMDLINKNMLYVNLCDIDDEEFGVTEEEKAFTNSFNGRG